MLRALKPSWCSWPSLPQNPFGHMALSLSLTLEHKDLEAKDYSIYLTPPQSENTQTLNCPSPCNQNSQLLERPLQSDLAQTVSCLLTRNCIWTQKIVLKSQFSPKNFMQMRASKSHKFCIIWQIFSKCKCFFEYVPGIKFWRWPRMQFLPWPCFKFRVEILFNGLMEWLYFWHEHLSRVWIYAFDW